MSSSISPAKSTLFAPAPETGARDKIKARTWFAGLAGAAALSACTTAPTPQEASVAEMIAAKTIIPATRAERDAADQTDVLNQAAFWGREYDKNPNDYESALKLARVLRSMGSAQRSAEVAAQALNFKPGDPGLTLVFAQASLDQGRPEAAISHLARAEQAGSGDWQFLSTVGIVLDQMGRHSEARNYYNRALSLSPDNTKVMTNLGLSWALDGKPKQAEEILRKASERPDADARVKQNLSLVLGIQGKFSEAEEAIEGDTPRSLLESNQTYYRALLTPKRSWDTLRSTQN
jgi:Flp pilus assembly protein TadD